MTGSQTVSSKKGAGRKLKELKEIQRKILETGSSTQKVVVTSSHFVKNLIKIYNKYIIQDI